MKLLIPVAAAFAALLSLSSPVALAVDDKPAEAAAPDTQQVQPKKKVKPHSHVEDKGGAPQTAPEPQKADKPNPATDRSKHYHPRDAK